MSHYTVSSSESSSFCTNQASNRSVREGAGHPESVVVSASKRASTHASAGAALGMCLEEEAAAAAYIERTPTKVSQSTKSSTKNTTHESPSMTIRRVPLDYSKRMEDQRARSNAMERYKMLVRGARPVEGARLEEISAPAGKVKKLPTQRDGTFSGVCLTDQERSPNNETDFSDEVEARKQEPPLPVARSCRSAPGPASSSSSHQRGKAAKSLSSPASVSVTGDHTASPPTDSAVSNVGDSVSGDRVKPMNLQLNLSKALAAQSSSAAQYGPLEEGAAVVQYVAPELTQPYPTSRQPRRDTVRPGYEPVTAHDDTCFQRTSSVSAQDDNSPFTSVSKPRRQSKADASARAFSRRSSAVPATPSRSDRCTPARKKSLVGTFPAMAAAADITNTTKPLNLNGVASELFPTEKEGDVPQQADARAKGTECNGAAVAEAIPQSKPEALHLAGSKTAFWLRPSTAMYEMTASIAAKRKDHHTDEEDIQSSSSRRHTNQLRFNTANASTSSSCCTPRSHASIAVEAKPRFTTCVTAADRARYEEVPVTVGSARTPTYESIYSARHSTAHTTTSALPQQKISRRASAVNRSLDSPRCASHQQLQRAASRVESARSPLDRRHSTLSRLSSEPRLTLSSDERHCAADTGRVSVRQQDSFSKHCARVATRKSATEGTAEIATGPSKVSKRRAVAVSKAEFPTTLEARTKPASEAGAEAVLNTTLILSPEHSLTTPVEGGLVPPSPVITSRGRRGSDNASPSKSRRCESDITASPSRPNEPSDLELCLAAQDVAVGREEEGARVQEARERLQGCRQARQARMESRQAGHTKDAVTVSTNEVVAAMLQGIVQQTRQALPCYMCADEQTAAAYLVHVDLCRPKAEALLQEYYTTVTDTKDIPEELQERIRHMASREIPSIASPETVRDTFTKECYQCVKALLVSCRKCSIRVRVQDLKEHEMLCGRACYQSSRAAERVRVTLQRIKSASE